MLALAIRRWTAGVYIFEWGKSVRSAQWKLGVFAEKKDGQGFWDLGWPHNDISSNDIITAKSGHPWNNQREQNQSPSCFKAPVPFREMRQFASCRARAQAYRQFSSVQFSVCVRARMCVNNKGMTFLSFVKER